MVPHNDFLVSAYHPDTLRAPRGETAALAWNVFKTMEQLAPTIWMRPLLARLGCLDDPYRSAPHTVSVGVWQQLDPSPRAMLRRARLEPVRADVVVSTDDTLITVVTPTEEELYMRLCADASECDLLELIESTSWIAGTRVAYTGLVLPLGADEGAVQLFQRKVERVYRSSRDGLRPIENHQGVGVSTWGRLLALLAECAASPRVAAHERALARAVESWANRFKLKLLVSE
jgi:hypothetical protein